MGLGMLGGVNDMRNAYGQNTLLAPTLGLAGHAAKLPVGDSGGDGGIPGIGGK